MHRTHDPTVGTAIKLRHPRILRSPRLISEALSAAPLVVGSRAYMGTPTHRQRHFYDSVTFTRKTASSHRCGARAHPTIVLHLGNHTRRTRRANRPIPPTLSPDRCPCLTPLPQASRQPSSRSHASPGKNRLKRTTAVLTAATAPA